MNIDSLTDVDYKILDLVNRNQPIALSELRKKLPTVESLDYRIQLLCTLELRQGEHFTSNLEKSSFLVEDCEYVSDSVDLSGIRYLQIYRLTDLGQKVLQDHSVKTKHHKRELWLKNAWIPIIVAFVTTVLTNYMLPMLLQTIGLSTHIP